jgi:hypothetical protein
MGAHCAAGGLISYGIDIVDVHRQVVHALRPLGGGGGHVLKQFLTALKKVH